MARGMVAGAGAESRARWRQGEPTSTRLRWPAWASA